MAFQEKQLGQLAPADTNAASIYSPTSGTTIVKTIIIANVTAIATTFRLFLDGDGATYAVGTALFYDIPIDANATIQLDVFCPMNNTSGNLAVRSGTPSALTFTVFGVEIT